MKLELDLETDHEDKYLKHTCVSSALDKIKTAVMEERSRGTIEHDQNGYRAEWTLEDN